MADQMHYGDLNYNEVATRSQHLTLDQAGKAFVLQSDRQSAMFTKTAVEADMMETIAARQAMNPLPPITVEKK